MDRAVADVMYAVACGLDVHLAVVVACLVRSGPKGGSVFEERSFATTLRGLRELRDWLLAAGCEAVGMEATGVYWLPVYSVLEGHVQMVVGNPNHMQNLRGHKTDRKDAKWISGLIRHGLIRPSYVPRLEFRKRLANPTLSECASGRYLPAFGRGLRWGVGVRRLGGSCSRRRS